MTISSVGGTDPSTLLNNVQNTTDTQQTSTTSTQGVKKHHKHHHPPSVDSMLSQLTAKLGLNDNQMADLKNILNKSLSSLTSTDQSGQVQNGSTNANNSQTKSILDNMNMQIKGILNPDQLATFNNMLQTQGGN
jgi:hypothetical protein